MIRAIMRDAGGSPGEIAAKWTTSQAIHHAVGIAIENAETMDRIRGEREEYEDAYGRTTASARRRREPAHPDPIAFFASTGLFKPGQDDWMGIGEN